MEQMIVFVYDTMFCRTEADDPQKAVLYFHPHWVSDQQRLALCGQLMGAAHFCSSVFSTPKVMTLQCGKFFLKKFGRYILSVGSDQTLPEWILKERFNVLELLIEFYQNSFESLYNEAKCDQEAFSKKLTEILETYIPVLQNVVSALRNVFLVKYQKKNSAAFLEAYQLLEASCSFKGVLGGVILHEGRIVATQLEPDLTKLLTLSDRFHIKAYAEHIKTSFNLPAGVQLFKVYLKQKVYEKLHSSANLKTSTFNLVPKNIILNGKKTTKKKKEFSNIFTVHEEEDQFSFSNKTDCIPKNESSHYKSKKLKTKFENGVLKERSKNFTNSSNIKVCSTPTVEKTLIHEELVSICSGKVDQKSHQSALISAQNSIIGTINSNHCHDIPVKYSSYKMQRISMDDLMIDLSHQAYPVPLRYYSIGLPKLCREIQNCGKGNKSKKRFHKKHFYNTIADPMNPVFRQDGIPVSKSLYNNCLDEHYKDFIAANQTIDSREEFLKNKYLENSETKPKTEPKVDSLECKAEHNSNSVDSNDTKMESGNVEVKETCNVNQKALRRSLSLPLKPLLCDKVENTSQNVVVRNKVLNAKTPTTPLTTRLSLLAFEESKEPKPISTPCYSDIKDLKRYSSFKRTENDENKTCETLVCSLFAFNYQNMSMLLILDEEVANNSNVILSLRETSFSVLRNVENLRVKSTVNLSNSENNNSSYSFLSMDSNWGTLQKSGSWSDDDLKMIGSLHHDLIDRPKTTEIILRNEDSVVYGYSCGGTKIFYQQGGCSSIGLPTPADLMGVVTLKARRRLERDRDILLL